MKYPIPEHETTAPSPSGPVLVRPYQMVVQINLRINDYLSPSFPAILDSGNSHNFSIRQEHLQEWVKTSLKQKGFIRVNKVLVPLAEADVELNGKHIQCPGGIAVFPEDHPYAPRLPLLGLRAIVRNGLTAIIDGETKELSIR